MTVRLTIRTATWRAGVAGIAARVAGLVPVVKGNGYGFGRPALARVAADIADTIAVGTVHELGGLPDGPDIVVLTPSRTPPETTDPILTVGRPEHVDALAGWKGRVIVKCRSSMNRYGQDDVERLVDHARASGLEVEGVAVHLPLEGTSSDHAAEIVGLLDRIDPTHTLWLSHLDPEDYDALPRTHRYRLRLGTALWLGDRSSLHLQADVLDTRPLAPGERAGYRLVRSELGGTLVMIGAGTANGVTPLDDGRSPFHFERTRLPLLEKPHMHTAMCVVARGEPTPSVGDWVDVQRPLTMTLVDEYRWL